MDLPPSTDAHDILDRVLNLLVVKLHECMHYNISLDSTLSFGAVQTITLHYVWAGEGAVQLGNGRVISLEPQSVLILPKLMPQNWKPADEARMGPSARASAVDDQAGLAIAVAGGPRNVAFARSEISIGLGGGVDLSDHLREPIVDKLPDRDPARLIFSTMLAEMAHPRIGSRAFIEALLKQFLLLLLRRELLQNNRTFLIFSLLRDCRLSRTVVDILERPERAYAVEKMAAMAGLSRSSFAGRFRRAVGQSPIEFVQTVRLRRAADLLCTTGLPVKAIAGSVGYSSRSHFSRLFRAVHGMDPSAFRSRGRCRQKASDLAAPLPEDITWMSHDERGI